MNNLARKILYKLIKVASRFIDSYSLYFNSSPSKMRVKRLSRYAKIAKGVEIAGKITVPTPNYVEIGENVSCRRLNIAPKKFVLIERDVIKEDIYCQHYTILTNPKSYEGKEIDSKVLTISVDLEAGVGLSHVPRENWDYYRKFWDSKNAAEKLARLFKKYEIPLTWAICGHLFLRECDGKHEFTEEDWFGPWLTHDPATDYKNDSAWYMPDLIQFLAGEPLFEIGYHSYGHFDYQQCSEGTAKKDILLANKIRTDWGLKLESFVFPYNQCGYFNLLAKEGNFRNFRGNIGFQYPAYGILDFKDFRFFNTTHMFYPDTMDICNSQLSHLPKKTFNYYTHCYQWIEKDGWKDLEHWLRELNKLKESGNIIIKRMNEI